MDGHTTDILLRYLCGHGHCYACIRVLLEDSWQCPKCRSPITIPPFRNYDLEEGIAFDHPDWRDTSVVDYSWEGLSFPKPFTLAETP